MFYEEKVDKILRFGDVITNIVEYTPIIDDLTYNRSRPYFIECKMNQYYVVMSPCCSIENNILSVTPLLQLNPSLIKNSYLCDDFTRLNVEMDPRNSVPSESWEKMGVEKQNQLLAMEQSYAFLNLFIYKKDIKLKPYVLKTKSNSIETGFYMIDFKNIFYISSKEIQRGKDLSFIKILQLSIDTRKELRDKLTHYFSRVPDEDKI